MRQLSPAGQELIAGIAQRHGFGIDATMSMLESVINGNGSMAQFSHPEFAGSGQWMRGGMTMVSDMFNGHLKNRVDNLCSELSNVIASQPDLVRTGSFQSQSQGGGGYQGNGQTQSNHGGNSSSQQQGGGNFGAASLFVPGTSNDWWPSDLRFPNSTGAQNGVRYAYFAQARRLAIDVAGIVTVYDTLDHQIGGFSQQQSVGGTLSFNSQYGLIDVASLPVISWNGQAPKLEHHWQNPVPAQSSSNQRSSNHASSNQRSAPTGNEQDVFATIEKLAELRAKGVLSDDEFLNKKSELLSRL